MRIIGGFLKRRRIKAPEGRSTRPMQDRVRENLFNILVHHDWSEDIGDPLTGADVLDAFCGTGALAFESISRGAARATLFEKDKEALRVARENASALGVEKFCRIIQADATRPPETGLPCKLIFLSPPYRKGLVLPALEALEKAGWIDSHSLIVIETAKNEKTVLDCRHKILLSRSYGNTAIMFAKAES